MEQVEDQMSFSLLIGLELDKRIVHWFVFDVVFSWVRGLIFARFNSSLT